MSLSSSGSSKRANYNVQAATCVVDGCTADLSNCRKYHQRHKVCEVHSKSPEVSIKGQKLRFCQQCSRFHPLDEFDDGKRSCRKRLDGHNRRRRKPRPYIFSGHHATGMLQPSGPPAHPTMAVASHVWSQSNHAPSLLSSSEASCTTLNHLVHPSSSSFSITGNQLDSGLSFGGLENDSDAGWGGTIDRNPHEDPRTFPFYWQYS